MTFVTYSSTGDPLLQCGDCSRQCSDTLAMIAHSRDAKHMSSWQLIATTSEEQLLRAFSSLAPPAFDVDDHVDDAPSVQVQTGNSNQAEAGDSSSATIACQVSKFSNCISNKTVLTGLWRLDFAQHVMSDCAR